MRRKLFFSTLAIVLITLLLSILSVNFVFKQQFNNYLILNNEATLKQLPGRLSNIYLNKGTWDTLSLTEVSQNLPMGIVVTLQNLQGVTIATLENPMDSMHQGGDMMGMDMGMNMGYSMQNLKTKTLAINGPQGKIATAIVRYPASNQVLNPQDASFVTAVFRSLLLAGALALIIAAFLSYWTSRHLVSPLQRLAQAAYRIGQGHLDERVNISSKDEVEQLGQAFNSMADNLKRQENIRKQFTADIAHELRTPLTSIRSYIEAFQDGVLPADADNLSIINEEIERLVGLASDLKDLNVAEMGALKINRQSMSLINLLDKVTRNLQSLIQAKGLTLVWNPPSSDVLVPGDERLLTRLFYNLIHNSYKYTEQGGQITIDLRVTPEFALVQINDTGIGIAEAELPFIFERFYRTDKSRTRETGGSGIGLALVQQIAALHGGNIDVKSQVGVGSCFTVKLPL